MQEAKIPEVVKFTDFPDKKITAYYLGKIIVRIKDTTTQEEKYSIIHLFQKKDESQFEAWGFDQLNRKLSTVPKYSLVEITYLGKEHDPDADKDFHNVKVMFDSKQKISIEQ